MAKTKGVHFEETLARLEALATKLENDELNLEASLIAFEEGVKLTRSAQEALRAAERQIQLLLDQDGQPQTKPFNEVNPE